MEASLDGAPVDATAIPLLNDGRTHDVQIVLGDPLLRQLEVPRLAVALGKLEVGRFPQRSVLQARQPPMIAHQTRMDTRPVTTIQRVSPDAA
jgi:hypothetical protein